MEVRELSGIHIGRCIRWKVVSHQFNPDGRTEYEYQSDPITMITHKKNGNVLVRHGKDNRQSEFRKNFPIELIEEES